MAGSIVNAELKVDKEGKSRGMAIVQFETQLEAVQGICILNRAGSRIATIGVSMTQRKWQTKFPTGNL